MYNCTYTSICRYDVCMCATLHVGRYICTTNRMCRIRPEPLNTLNTEHRYRHRHAVVKGKLQLHILQVVHTARNTHNERINVGTHIPRPPRPRRWGRYRCRRRRYTARAPPPAAGSSADPAPAKQTAARSPSCLFFYSISMPTYVLPRVKNKH